MHCHVSYAGVWELVKQFVETKIKRYHVCFKRSDFMPGSRVGTQNLNPKCPALKKCYIQLPGT